MVKNSTIGKFIIKGGDNNRTFLLKNVLIILKGFILVRRCKVQLSTIIRVGWVVVFNKGEWVGNVPVMELYVEEFMIIQRKVWGGFSILWFNWCCWGRDNYLFSKRVIVTG